MSTARCGPQTKKSNQSSHKPCLSFCNSFRAQPEEEVVVNKEKRPLLAEGN